MFVYFEIQKYSKSAHGNVIEILGVMMIAFITFKSRLVPLFEGL